MGFIVLHGAGEDVSGSSSDAIFRSASWEPRYGQTEGPAITPKPAGATRPSWVITSSVSPRLKYACAGSPFRSSNGRTAKSAGSRGVRKASQPAVSRPQNPQAG